MPIYGAYIIFVKVAAKKVLQLIWEMLLKLLARSSYVVPAIVRTVKCFLILSEK